jgi:Fe-S-cluster containining protein
VYNAGVSNLQEAVRSAAGRKDVRDGVARVYQELQREIDARKPICNTSGRCCRFEEFGHRLYVTTAELAAFVGEQGTRSKGQRGASDDWDGRGCPFQVGGLCGVHPIRPFGCRIYFCDATSTNWQNEQYERFHADLKRLHDTLSVPYFYVEWRAAVADLEIASSAPPPTTSKPVRSGLSLPQLPL